EYSVPPGRGTTPARDDEGGDPPEGLADDSARGRGAIPRSARPRSQLRRRRAGRAAPARDGGVAPRAGGESEPGRAPAPGAPARPRRGQDPLHGGAAAAHREVLRRDRPAAPRQEGGARG